MTIILQQVWIWMCYQFQKEGTPLFTTSNLDKYQTNIWLRLLLSKTYYRVNFHTPFFLMGALHFLSFSETFMCNFHTKRQNVECIIQKVSVKIISKKYTSTITDTWQKGTSTPITLTECVECVCLRERELVLVKSADAFWSKGEHEWCVIPNVWTKFELK